MDLSRAASIRRSENVRGYITDRFFSELHQNNSSPSSLLLMPYSVTLPVFAICEWKSFFSPELSRGR